MLLDSWAARWNIPQQAVAELRQVMGLSAPSLIPPASGLHSEGGLQSAIRLEVARRGARVWRNNNGACRDETGRMIRYGLANDSVKSSEVMKSSDLIGIWPYRVQPGDVGQIVGLFTALECKKPGWHMTPGDKRAKAQLTFIQLIVSLGGIARFVTRVEDLD